MIALNLSPAEEAQLAAAAQQTGLDPAQYVTKLVQEHLSSASVPLRAAVDDENAAAIAQLQAWMKEEATNDPQETLEAEADLSALMQNLNRNRIESRERSLFG